MDASVSYNKVIRSIEKIESARRTLRKAIRKAASEDRTEAVKNLVDADEAVHTASFLTLKALDKIRKGP